MPEQLEKMKTWIWVGIPVPQIPRRAR